MAMPDDDELIARSRAIRALAKDLAAWSAAVRETSRSIMERGIDGMRFGPDEPGERGTPSVPE